MIWIIARAPRGGEPAGAPAGALNAPARVPIFWVARPALGLAAT